VHETLFVRGGILGLNLIGGRKLRALPEPLSTLRRTPSADEKESVNLATPLRRRLCAALILPAGALGVASCGGDDEDVQEVLDKAFSTSIPSADLSLQIEADVKGVERLDSPIRVQVSGPFKGGGGKKLPSLDWKLNLTGGGQSFTAGAVSTGDNVYVNYQGESYELGESTVRQFNEQFARSNRRGQDRTLEDLGLNPREWLKDAKEEGDEDVAGVETTHVSAGLDVAKLLGDLNNVIERAPGELRGQAPPKLTDNQIEQVEEIVKDPSFDVYVGKEDDRLRRLSADLEFEVPENDRDQVGGLEGGEISLSVEFANVGEEKRIEAPSGARPISQLLSQFGAGALGGLGGGSGSGGAGGSGGGGSGGSDQAPSADQFERYSRCLNKADTGDIQALQKCSELLR
jgi:hypothetical protein